jgi:LPXTG-site transpeptidase (sortase) family protein
MMIKVDTRPNPLYNGYQGGNGSKMKPTLSLTQSQGSRSRRTLAHVLMVLGILALSGAVVYLAGSHLNSWIRGQDLYLTLQDIVPLPNPKPATPSPADQRTPVSPAQALGEADASSIDGDLPTPTPRPTGTATPEASPTPAPPDSQPPVRIRIPDLGITRSIINVPPVLDQKTGKTTHDVNGLFRPGRKDLVGHWEGSALPGEHGNMILVGHNYGVGYNGVFVRLGRLKEGQKVVVIDEAGTSFTYVVDTVKRVKWRRKNTKELEAHWEYMSPNGPERLTLVTCGGANIEPFPDRIYVVAYPEH